MKGIVASAAYSVLTPIQVWRILVPFSSREESKRAIEGLVESHQLYPKVVYSYGQTGLSSLVSSCEDFARNVQKRRG